MTSDHSRNVTFSGAQIAGSDSPTRPSILGMTRQGVQTAAEVEQLVNREMGEGIHVASPDDFLKTFLPLPDGDKTIGQLTGKYGSEYLKTFGLPHGDATESVLYGMLVEAANAILGCCAGNVHSYWVSRPNTTPKSKDKSTAQLRPDAGCVLGDQRAYFRPKAWVESVLAYADAHIKYHGEVGEDLIELEKLSSIWWLRVTTPVEVKPTDSKQHQTEGSAQLCRYMRQVLRAQLDRRFVFGLLLCNHKLRVFFCDRSGLLGSSTWIDIRERPEQFVQVIVGLSSLSPEKLGWDPTMHLRLQTEKDKLVFVPSTAPNVKIEDYGSSAYETQWAIFMPNAHGSADGKWYVTTRALSLSRAEVMVGRATLVWLVKELSKRLVLKSAWGRAGSATEKDFYGDERLDHVGHVLCSATIGCPTIAEKGMPSLRGGVDSVWREWRDGYFEQSTVLKGRARSPEDSFAHEQGGPRATEPERPLAPRILTRTLMETYGWPIKYFKDLKELLTVTRDTIRGHRNLYFKNRTLQRDVSGGNMLVCPNGDEVSETHGELIDLDHAKKAHDCILYEFDCPSPSSVDTLQTYIAKIVSRVLDLKIGPVDRTLVDAVARRCQEHRVAVTIENIIRLFKRNPHLMLSEKRQEPESKGAFWARIQEEGTVAFMSAEVLGLTQYFGSDEVLLSRTDCSNSVPVHTAIHDAESVFWVFLYLCLTRRGPGGARREELQNTLPAEADAAYVKGVRSAVESFFDSPFEETVTRNKCFLFRHPSTFTIDVLPFIHPYFLPLEPLLLKWWKFFQIAYRTYDDVAQGVIHDQILDILDEGLASLPEQTDPVYDKMTKTELARRRKDLAQYDAFQVGQLLAPSSPTFDGGRELISHDSPHRFHASSVKPVPPAPQQPPSPTEGRTFKKLKTESLMAGGSEVGDNEMGNRQHIRVEPFKSPYPSGK
ncbi:hypothetical protein BXZ70DRAFT_899761 [Cristinia sonorae]|uniref:Fungal-type protein kinase domain-containing protein n=1 Tax=Cristinia sonorae TaxID=1940300 RepID=A0A8K0XL74_9AGAR|nr:hypothetical protein BXZ70DRAFT_899761 [Cristinia sonorae]